MHRIQFIVEDAQLVRANNSNTKAQIYGDGGAAQM